jgi:hypothetical protein
MRDLAHTQDQAQQFLQEFQSAFTTRSDGSTWPKWERTWCHASHCFRGLIRPGNSTVSDIATQLQTDQEQLERFNPGKCMGASHRRTTTPKSHPCTCAGKRCCFDC